MDKLWIEVDVEPDRANKTEKITEVIVALEKVPCVKNVTKVQYKIPISQSENET